MRRKGARYPWWAGGAVVALALALLLPGPAAAFHKRPAWKCGFHWRKSRANRVKVLRCWGERRGVGKWKTVRVARCESGADLLDDYVADGLGGTFQHIASAWPRRARAHGAAGYGIRNVWAQAKVSTAMARDDPRGWSGHWPVCGRA